MAAHVLTRFNRSVRQLDGVFLAIALILIALAILVPSQVAASLAFTLKSLWHVAPFLLLSLPWRGGLCFWPIWASPAWAR